MLTATRTRAAADVQVLSVTRSTNGVISVSALVEYPCDEWPSLVTFIGDVYGGPVIIIAENGSQAEISPGARARTDAGGPFAINPTAWVRRFYA